jgi:hypothetical protein
MACTPFSQPQSTSLPPVPPHSCSHSSMLGQPPLPLPKPTRCAGPTERTQGKKSPVGSWLGRHNRLFRTRVGGGGDLWLFQFGAVLHHNELDVVERDPEGHTGSLCASWICRTTSSARGWMGQGSSVGSELVSVCLVFLFPAPCSRTAGLGCFTRQALQFMSPLHKGFFNVELLRS